MIISHNYITPHFSPKKLVFIPYGVILSPFCVPNVNTFYELFILSIIKTFQCHVKPLNVFFVEPFLALSQSVKPFLPIWKLFDIYLPPTI